MSDTILAVTAKCTLLSAGFSPGTTYKQYFS
jgi:hypothetical protein